MGLEAVALSPGGITAGISRVMVVAKLRLENTDIILRQGGEARVAGPLTKEPICG
jgi:hypothetical protein